MTYANMPTPAAPNYDDAETSISLSMLKTVVFLIVVTLIGGMTSAVAQPLALFAEKKKACYAYAVMSSAGRCISGGMSYDLWLRRQKCSPPPFAHHAILAYR